MLTISIVIATYNRASLLRRTLESLKCQAYGPGDEIVIVDNGSTDETPAVLAHAASDFPIPVHIIGETTPGKGPALCAGIRATRGTVLALTDDDVVVASDWIATIRELFTNSEVALVGGRVDPYWESPPPAWLQMRPGAPYGEMFSPFALLHYGAPQELESRTAVGANLAIRRSVLDAVGGIKPDLARRVGSLFGVEDQDLCQRVRLAGHSCQYRPELRVQHWVPVARMRLPYFFRWFFWSGYANALLGTDDPIGADGRRCPIVGYFLRQVVTASSRAVVLGLSGKFAAAVQSSMRAAYSAGYVCERVSARGKSKKSARIATASLLALTVLGSPAGPTRMNRQAPRRAGVVASLRSRSRPVFVARYIDTVRRTSDGTIPWCLRAA